MSKTTKILLFFIICTMPFYAQDIVYKNDKTEIKAKVLEILDNEIKYKKYDFLEGPTYSLKKDQIFIILYSNGQKEMFTNPVSVPIQDKIISKKTESKTDKKSEIVSKKESESEIVKIAESKPRVEKKSDNVDVDYDRSSLYTLMITNSSRDYENEIKSYFQDKLTPDKYNDHNLENRLITSAFKKKDQLDNIVDYLNENKVAQKLVAKWFNRSEKGGFNIDLIKERGYYDASASEINQAKYAKRGMAQLINPEVIKKLIDNTFILVIDSQYTNKEKVASTGKSILSILGNVPGLSMTNQLTALGGGLVLDTFGKGFWVSTNAHLFKLVWDDDIANRFDNELWCDDKTVTPEKRKAFDNADFFALEYVGTDHTGADIQSTGFTTKTNGELVGRATVKSIENVITKLQENYDVFKTKTPIYTSEPLTAKIGLKEGVTKKTKFEVLEQQLTDDGTLEFVQVGSVKVDTKYQIWDNRYGADEENPNQSTDKTYFKVVSGKEFAPGMLLRQIK